MQKLAIITGASDGLGLEIGKVLAEKSYKVISLSRTKPKFDQIDWIKTDLMNFTSIDSSCEQIIKMPEKIAVLINCAAVVSYEDIDVLTAKEVDKMMKTNVTAPMLLTSKLLYKLQQDSADIVNVGATIALKAGYSKQTTYSTTKWALRGFTQNLQSELKSSSCRVVDLLLGGFNSRLHEKVTGNPITDPQNWMDPTDIAKLLAYLLELPKNIEISEIIVNRKNRR